MRELQVLCTLAQAQLTMGGKALPLAQEALALARRGKTWRP